MTGVSSVAESQISLLFKTVNVTCYRFCFFIFFFKLLPEGGFYSLNRSCFFIIFVGCLGDVDMVSTEKLDDMSLVAQAYTETSFNELSGIDINFLNFSYN